MLKRALILTAALVALLVFLGENGIGGGEASKSQPGRVVAAGQGDEGPPPVGLPTKVSRRDAAAVRPTHAPARLKDFYLPEVDVAGLPLSAALRKLQAAYEDACRESGEVPVELAFVTPPDRDPTISAKLGVRTLDGSVRRLAGLAGLKVTRDEATYVFTAPEETGKPRTRKLRVPPDFGSVPSETADDPFSTMPASVRLSPAEWFARQGVELDPSTRLILGPATFSLQLETTSAADEVAVTSLIQAMAGEAPLQHKLETRVLELGADLDWTQPELSQLDEAAMQRLFHDLAEQGAQLTTLPATVTRAGMPAKIEIVRELITPVGGSEDRFETHQIGKVLDLNPVPLGFGHRVDLNFTDTTFDVDPATGEVRIERLTDIADTAFAADGQARLHVETRPDGTRTVVLVTPTLIDATGRPRHGGE